jgi:hypothetical protein
MTEESNWQSVISVLDARVAHSIANLLEAEMISVRVIPDSRITDATPSWTVLVSVKQLEAARNLLTRSQFTDADLTFLATGELSGTDDSG